SDDSHTRRIQRARRADRFNALVRCDRTEQAARSIDPRAKTTSARRLPDSFNSATDCRRNSQKWEKRSKFEHVLEPPLPRRELHPVVALDRSDCRRPASTDPWQVVTSAVTTRELSNRFEQKSTQLLR